MNKNKIYKNYFKVSNKIEFLISNCSLIKLKFTCKYLISIASKKSNLIRFSYMYM